MEKYARQGDLVIDLVPVDGDLAPTRGLQLVGRDSSPHTIVGEVLHRRDGRTTLVRVLEATQIEHGGRHRPTPLVPGDYRIGPLRERGGDGDRAVED